MMITKEVEVLIVGNTLKYYKSLGYDVKVKDKIKVKVSDLKKCSKETVQVQCDSCGKIVDFHFDAYRKYREDFLNTEYKCRECEIKEIWDKVINKCIELNCILVSGIEIYNNHQTKVEFICNIHKEKGIQYVSVNNLLSKNSGCKLCANIKIGESKLLDFEFVKSKFIERNYILLETEYINAKTQMRYICPIHNNIIQTITYDKLSQGHGCEYCGNERIGDHFRLDFNIVEELFKSKDFSLISKQEDYKNRLSPLKYICNKHKEYGIQTTSYHHINIQNDVCKCCQYENSIGEKSSHYKGGITPLYNYLRDKIYPWKFDTMNKYNFTCDLTNMKFDIVHHLYGFNNIVLETLQVLNLPLFDQINKYSENELLLIQNKCLELHYKHGLGVCLCEPIHRLFHSIYLCGNNTIEQYEEFKQKYYNFEFDEFLDDKYKYKIILLKEVG